MFYVAPQSRKFRVLCGYCFVVCFWFCTMTYSKYYFQPLNRMRLWWGKGLSRGLYKGLFMESTPRKLGSYLSRRVFTGWSLQPMPSSSIETHVRQTWSCFEIVTGRLNVLKMAIQPKTISSSNAITTRIPIIFSTDSEQIQTFVWPQRASAMLSIERIQLETSR